MLVSVKYRYCWVDRGRELDNGFVSEGLGIGEVSVISETALAGLFLEVIVRHMPGQVGSRTRCLRTITEWDLAAV
nr:hypothetical protein FFPRI1PSEUD_15870 [Pseudomonas sp. FFPRI_1]